MAQKIAKTPEEWKKELSTEQYHVMREKGTEAPFTGKYVDNHENGMYTCGSCGSALFSSDTKFDSGSGWPSFWDVIDKGNVVLEDDSSLGMRRTEVKCGVCDAHLGHLFTDGPRDKTGMRYCINSAALSFEKKKE